MKVTQHFTSLIANAKYLEPCQ